MWSHVIGAIEVDTLSKTSAETLYVAQTVVDHLPTIRGGETDAEVYVTLVRGYNCSSTHNEWDIWVDGGVNHQTHALIMVRGNLRYTDQKDALRDVVKFLNRLSKQLLVVKGVMQVNKTMIPLDPWCCRNYEWQKKER